MSMVTTLVFVAQYFRGLSNKFKQKAIFAIQERINKIEEEQVDVEEHRSSQMIDCHNRYYASRDDLNARQVKEVEEMLAATSKSVTNWKLTSKRTRHPSPLYIKPHLTA
ncbi:TPA: hypothetical protein L0114_004008 [Escherichia coli]|nr:hypothetical protein [Escherichia coli]